MPASKPVTFASPEPELPPNVPAWEAQFGGNSSDRGKEREKEGGALTQT